MCIFVEIKTSCPYLQSSRSSIFQKPCLSACWDKGKEEDFLEYCQLLRFENSWWFPGRGSGKGPFWWRAELSLCQAHLQRIHIHRKKLFYVTAEKACFHLSSIQPYQKYLTGHGGFHPREGDSSNDTFTKAQQERASLFFRQEWLLSAFAHKPHDVATVYIKRCMNNKKLISFPTSQRYELYCFVLHLDHTMLRKHTHPSTGLQGMFSPWPRCHQTTPRTFQEYFPVTDWVEKGINKHL